MATRRKRTRGSKKAKTRKKKKKATTPSLRKVMAPDSPFARVSPPPTHVPEGVEPDWYTWAVKRGGSPLGEVPAVDRHRLDDVKAQTVFDELNRLDVEPSIAAELASINPRGTYVVIATVSGGSGRAGKDEGDRRMPARPEQNQVILVGRGARLWGSFMHLADPDGGGSELLDVEVIEADPGAKDEAFPLWAGYTVEVEGRTIEGTGIRPLWERYRAEKAMRKGRRKKSGGGMTAAERRKAKGAERARKSRAAKSTAKMRALQLADPVAAARLRKKRDKARKARRKKK